MRGFVPSTFYNIKKPLGKEGGDEEGTTPFINRIIYDK